MADPFVDVTDKQVSSEEASGTGWQNFASIEIGRGSKVLRCDQSGLWMGAETWALAPFRVDMDGNVVMSSVTITGYIPTGGAAADVNAGVTTINAAKINISGSTTFAAGYDPALKVDETGGIYTTTATASAAKVQIFPDANTGIVAYTTGGTDVVFKVMIGGTDVGDVTIGNYSGGQGALWDQSAGTLKIKGNIEAGNIDGVTITGSNISTGVSGETRVTMTDASDAINWYDSGNDIGLTINLVSSTAAQIESKDGRALTLVSASGRVEFSSIIDLNGNNLVGGGTITATTFSGALSGNATSATTATSCTTATNVSGGSVSATTGYFSSWGSFGGDLDMNGNSITEVNRVTGSTGYIDFNEGGELKISTNANVSGNLKSRHHDPASNKAYNLGGDSLAWDYVYADDFINKSVGWYDDGVTLQNGTKVSDMEALRLIRPHPRMVNKNGSRELDFTTLPVEVFRLAVDENKVPLERNKFGDAISKTGEVVGDGVSLTHFVSLIFGALKEVDSRLIKIEKGIK